MAAANPVTIPKEVLEDDETMGKYDALKNLGCVSTDLIKFSKVKYIYSLNNRLDSSATEGQTPNAVIIEYHRKSTRTRKYLPKGSVEMKALSHKKNVRLSSSSAKEPPRKVSRTSPKLSHQSLPALPSDLSFTGLLESVPDTLSNDLRKRQHACQEAASGLYHILSKIQSNIAEARASHQKAALTNENFIVPDIEKQRKSAALLSGAKSINKRVIQFDETQTIAPPSRRRVALLRSLYKNGGLRAVAASHDFLGGLVDVKFEPTGRYPIILGASACDGYSPDNVGAGSGHTAIMYNYVTGQSVAHAAHGKNTVSEVDFLRDGSLGFTAGYDGHIFAWKVDTPTEPPERFQIVRTPKNIRVERLQASKYHDLLICSVADSKDDPNDEKTRGEVLGISFLPGRTSSSSLSTIASSSSYMMQHGDSENSNNDLEGTGGSDAMHSINDSELGNGSNGHFSEANFEVFRPFDSHKYACNDITFGGVGLETWVFCACKNGAMMAGDINSTVNGVGGGDKASVICEGKPPQTAIACAARTKLVAFGDESGVVRAWDPRERNIVAETYELKGDFNCMSFSPSDMLLQCSSAKSLVYIFDVRNFSVPLRVLQHENISKKNEKGILMSRWSPSGFLFSCGEDTTMRIWDLAAGDPLLRVIRTHTNSVACVAISPDESVVVSGDDSKRMVLHTLRGSGEGGDDESNDSDSIGYDRFAGAVGPIKLDC